MAGYSLHIGLNRVDPNAYGGWDGALSGCVNDANSMMQIASAQGFATTQLLDQHASSHAVIGELSLLAQQATAGDICLITYSGHGGQVDDANGDENDFKDETWVLYDRQVVDDELFQMWSQFAAGVRLLLISDSCHSGTVAKMVLAEGARENLVAHQGKARATADEIAVVRGAPKNLPLDVQAQDNERRRGTYQFVQALAGSKEETQMVASLILISGCQDNQLSYDGPVNGQFTGTLLQVWANGGFSGDYTAFHRAILDRMPPDQSPNRFTVGVVDQAFLAQQPFTITAPAGATPLTPTQPATTRPTLTQGMSGPDVQYLQQRLNAHGASLTLDGQFGPATGAAVRQFQSVHGLVTDGVVGARTWNALEQAPIVHTATSAGVGTSSTASTSGASSSGSAPDGGGLAVSARPTIRRGATGEHVNYLQTRLRELGYQVSIDDIFGPATESRVRSFQRSNSLPADGIVGSQTWGALG